MQHADAFQALLALRVGFPHKRLLLLQICAGTESRARACQQDRADAIISVRIIQRLKQRGRHFSIEGIAPLGAVKCDEAHGSARLY